MPRPRTGTIQLRGDRYFVRVTLASGQRPWIPLEPGVTEREARRKAAYYAEKYRDAEYTPKRGAGADLGRTATLEDLFVRWEPLIAEGALAPSTKAERLQSYANHLRPAFGKIKVEALSHAAIVRWLDRFRVARSASTVHHCINTLSKMIDDGMARGWVALQVNPARHQFVRDAVPPLELRARDAIARLDLAQAAVLCSSGAVPAERRVRYVVALTTGMRDGEISALTWSSLRDEGGVDVLRVTGSLAICGPEGRATMKGPKTRAGVRTIPVHRTAGAALAWWRAEGWRAHAGRDPKPEDPIFPSPGGALWRPRSAELLRADLKAAGLAPTFEGRPHEFTDLRHSFAGWLEAANVPGYHIDQLMGHAPASVRGRHYAAPSYVALRDAVEAIALDVAFPPGHGSPPPPPRVSSPESSPEAGPGAGAKKKNEQDQDVSHVRRGSQVVRQRFAKQIRALTDEGIRRENAGSPPPATPATATRNPAIARRETNTPDDSARGATDPLAGVRAALRAELEAAILEARSEDIARVASALAALGRARL